MKRDMDLIRKIILWAEEQPPGPLRDITIEGYSDGAIAHHCYLLVDSGLAAGDDITTSASEFFPEYFITHLTSAGHDFADSVRNEYVWNEFWEMAKQKGIKSASMDVVKKLLDTQIRKRLSPD